MENRQGNYTLEQIVDITIHNLQIIQVPVMLSETVGIPIQKSIKNLMVLKEQMEIERKAREIAAEDPEHTVGEDESDE